ncbi:ATP-dependent (S)-NAD(P)H-hydrate dehydratase [Gryllus bimaculatus]|nr:ATP-dependent (S)-NAD(P)H-hydrate dehydratase [Gryllus bimaculatus]
MSKCGKSFYIKVSFSVRCFVSGAYNKMGKDNELVAAEAKLLLESRKIVPPLTQKSYKGQAGRIGVIGGSLEYTGAPYFSAISALKVGCDLSHVFCPKDAAIVIKSYSPELIVHPVLDAKNAVEQIKPWIPRLHALVIGPGLGKEPSAIEIVSDIINLCRTGDSEYQKPLVIDADGLFMITQNPEVIRNYPHGAILTPNAIEFSRLAKVILQEDWAATPEPAMENVKRLAVALGPNIIVLHKGKVDVIADGGSGSVWQCSGPGVGRRCGGQGDLLSGSLGVFYTWALMASRKSDSKCQFPPGVIASYAGCRLTRECAVRAVARAGRSTVASDMIDEIHPAFETLLGE